ncbi:MAG: IS1634 family transposase, partial [Chloroflexi bacterium]
MNPTQTYETQRLDHLGIVAGLCREIGLVEQIDQQVGPVERKVSCGEAVLAMVLNALGFSSRALYLMPDYLRNKPVDLLIGAGLAADDFNDDTLGRSLDDLYACGVTEVFAHVATKALTVYGIEHQFVHLDSSSFHLHGQYEASDPDTEAISITHGYSRDHRPDLKQVVVQLITSQSSALPVWLAALSGNDSDRESFVPTVQAYCQHLAEGERPYFVMDSAGYGADNLQLLGSVRWLMRVPETLAEAKRLVQETPREAMSELAAGYLGQVGGLLRGGLSTGSAAPGTSASERTDGGGESMAPSRPTGLQLPGRCRRGGRPVQRALAVSSGHRPSRADHPVCPSGPTRRARPTGGG